MKTEPPTHLAFKRALLTRSPMPCNLIRFFCCRCCIASQTFPAVVLSCMVNSWRLDYFYSCRLRILTGKKHRQIKLQRLRKVWIRATTRTNDTLFLNWKKKIRKSKVVPGKTSFFVIGPFCTHHSICLDIGFWYSSFVWKWCVPSLSAFN